jgi:hypothetical protein
VQMNNVVATAHEQNEQFGRAGWVIDPVAAGPAGTCDVRHPRVVTARAKRPMNRDEVRLHTTVRRRKGTELEDAHAAYSTR